MWAVSGPKLSAKCCEKCIHTAVCKYVDDISRIMTATNGAFNECKFYQTKAQQVEPEEKREEKQPALETCERCGKKSYRVFECETCHKRICSNCAEIEQELDVNTGGFEEHVYCLDCAEEE